jgi:hypothetical protein
MILLFKDIRSDGFAAIKPVNWRNSMESQPISGLKQFFQEDRKPVYQ